MVYGLWYMMYLFYYYILYYSLISKDILNIYFYNNRPTIKANYLL